MKKAGRNLESWTLEWVRATKTAQFCGGGRTPFGNRQQGEINRKASKRHLLPHERTLAVKKRTDNKEGIEPGEMDNRQ